MKSWGWRCVKIGIRSLGGTRDMTRGSIISQMVAFALPLMVGNIFQMLYNTVDSIVVGQFVGKEALAAVNSTTVIINMLVFFFNGFSVGAGVLISREFGAGDRENLHRAIQTTLTATFLLCVAFTLIGVSTVRPMLRFMDTPDDVIEEAALYLTIYFWGFSGLLIYNMGSGILRAVGDTFRPLLFLILTSLLNIVLDLLFVVAFHAGIAGVAWATILSQLISSLLTMLLLCRTKEIYRFSFRDIKVELIILKQILAVGLPAAIQSVITAFSNIFVQSYINFFGSACMAGWGCYNKLDQFIMLPMSSMAMAATTFVSQNVGAKQESRATRGGYVAALLSLGITGVIALALFIFAEPAIRLFTPDASVIAFGALFLHNNVLFLLFNCVNHVLAGSLRGRGDSKGPMIVMLLSFVVIRQIYLFVVTRWVANTPTLVGLGYPVGWVVCFIIELAYCRRKGLLGGKKAKAPV